MDNPRLQRKVNRVWEMIERGSHNPIVQQLAVHVISRTVFGGERSYFDEWRKLFDWAQGNIDFVPERKGADFFQEADYTIRLGRGDCEDFTILLGAMGRHLGLPVKLRVASPDNVQWKHIYPMGGQPPARPRNWIALDASAKGQPIGWENRTSYRYFRDFIPVTYTL